jgi:hypothetical protein
MAQTYAEFLLENGATADEIKILDTPVARKGYERMYALAEAAAVEKQKAADLVKRNQEWATQVETQNQAYLRERDSAKVEAAAAAARIAKMGELGLIEIAERIEPGSVTPKPGETPAFDPKLLEPYVTRDTLMQVAEREGDAIATVQDITSEHMLLFGNDPTKRLNFRAMRKEAQDRKISVEALWQEKYNVGAAREAFAAKEKSEYEKRIAEDAVKKYRSEHPESNPLLGQPVISRMPFTTPPSASTAKQPWLKSDAEREMARTGKAVAALEAKGLVH